jgi:hypothetical protein
MHRVVAGSGVQPYFTARGGILYGVFEQVQQHVHHEPFVQAHVWITRERQLNPVTVARGPIHHVDDAPAQVLEIERQRDRFERSGFRAADEQNFVEHVRHGSRGRLNLL